MSLAAAIVTMKSRGTLVLKTLHSLRANVDRLFLYLNGYTECPGWARGLVDDYHCDPENRAGDTGNLFWADKWQGDYLSCDDDLAYHDQYPSIMQHWLGRLSNRAIVTTHGLRFTPGTTFFRKRSTIKVSGKGPGGAVCEVRKEIWKKGWEFQSRWDQPLMRGEWIHQPGSGVMAFNTDYFRIPAEWTIKNNADLLLGLWAYQNRIPVFCIPHGGWECEDTLPKGAPSIWRDHKADGFKARNQLISLVDWKECYRFAPQDSLASDAAPAVRQSGSDASLPPA